MKSQLRKTILAITLIGAGSINTTTHAISDKQVEKGFTILGRSAALIGASGFGIRAIFESLCAFYLLTNDKVKPPSLFDRLMGINHQAFRNSLIERFFTESFIDAGKSILCFGVFLACDVHYDKLDSQQDEHLK